MTFVSPPAFAAVPVAPRFTTGRLVIHSDDGNIGDFTHFWPKFTAHHADSQFLREALAPFCPDVNSGTIGSGANKMTWANLRAIQAAGSEILSHGRFHFGLKSYVLTEAASVGATTLNVGVHGGKLYLNASANTGVTQVITEGATTESVTVTANASGVLTLAAPLANAFTTAATIRHAEASALANLQGCINDAAAEGVTIAHHVWTWHDEDATARAWAATVFDSARGSPSQGPIDVQDHDLSALNGVLGPPLTSVTDDLLDTIQASDGLAIVYGHGEQDSGSLTQLAYLIDQAIARGVRIITQSEAVAFLTAA